MDATLKKKQALHNLNIGDIILCSNGHEYEFIRVKRSKFIAKRSGVAYDIPIEMFSKIVSHSEETKIDPNTLREGSLIYILNNMQEMIVYRFKYMINPYELIAENPITSTRIKMSLNLVKGTVDDLIKGVKH